VAEQLRLGLIGCGSVSVQYVQGCRRFSHLDVAACADVQPERAQRLAAAHGLAAVAVDELLADPAVDLCLNLTPPAQHAAISQAVLAAGKHVHSEKPLAATLAEGLSLLRLAQSAQLRLGCAPDTFLGGGLQTCRRLIDTGWIGEPVAAAAFMISRGHESWHPEPEFFYRRGAGPMLDMGPYYVTALVHLLGPVRRVSGAARISFPRREVTSQPHAGALINVETPTHVAGTLEFAAGPIATLVQSFDIWAASLPVMEIYGSEGTLRVPDPNTFGGPVAAWRPETRQWQESPLTHVAGVGRGIGVADLAHALRLGRPHRASAELACHVLEVMLAFQASAESGRHVEITSRCDPPAPLPDPAEDGGVRFD
jgi:predicted dehydrogenase